MIFPSPSDASDWDALLSDDAALREGVMAIVHRLGLGAAPRTRYDSGSVPVYALGPGHVLKLYPPPDAEHAAVEARTLAFVHGALPLPTPAVLATGELEGWHYLLMSQLQGRRLVEAWPALAAQERDRLADALGDCVGVLHGLDATPLFGMPPQWADFVPAQLASAVARQRGRGLAAHWLAQIPAFLEAWMPDPTARCALLHTEIMREHLMVEPGPDGAWRLSGLFDFEPAMLGDAGYDFASIGLFVACGDHHFLRRTLLACGYHPEQLEPALSCRFMAHALLHRYSNLAWYLERLPAPGATTLEQLAQRWWPLSAIA